MSEIGYYRYKVDDLSIGSRVITFYKNGALSGQKTVVTKEFCEGQKLLKFLDKKGQYRFYPFNKYFETKDKPKLLGKANKIVETVLNSQSDADNVGYKNERTISVVADSVSTDEMAVLSDIYTSPRVYLQVGDGDLAKDWIKVEIQKGNQVTMRKTKFGTVQLDVILPTWYTIKMI